MMTKDYADAADLDAPMTMEELKGRFYFETPKSDNDLSDNELAMKLADAGFGGQPPKTLVAGDPGVVMVACPADRVDEVNYLLSKPRYELEIQPVKLTAEEWDSFRKELREQMDKIGAVPRPEAPKASVDYENLGRITESLTAIRDMVSKSPKYNAEIGRLDDRLARMESTLAKLAASPRDADPMAAVRELAVRVERLTERTMTPVGMEVMVKAVVDGAIRPVADEARGISQGILHLNERMNQLDSLVQRKTGGRK